MSAFSDFLSGNWGNIGHDLSADPWGTAAGIAGTAALIAAPFTFGATLPAAGALFGGVEGTGALAGGIGADVLGSTAATGAADWGLFGGAGLEGALGGTDLAGLYGGGGADLAGMFGGEGSSVLSGGYVGDMFGGLTPNQYVGDIGGYYNFPQGVNMTQGFDQFGGAPNLLTSDPSAAGGFNWFGEAPSATGATAPGFETVSGINPSGTELSTLNQFGTAGVPGGGPAGEAAAGGSWWDSLTGAVSKNPFSAIGAAGVVGGLGLQLARGNQQGAVPGYMGQQAGQLGDVGAANVQLGRDYASYMQNNTVPEVYRSAIDRAVKAMHARIVTNYANRGVSTDPRKNTSLMEDLNNLYGPQFQQMTLQVQKELLNAGNTLMTTGANEIQLSSQMFQYLNNLNRQDQEAMGKSIANAAAAIGNIGRPSVNLNSLFGAKVG